jgi:hypothetical protein
VRWQPWTFTVLDGLAPQLMEQMSSPRGCCTDHMLNEEITMGFGRGALLWLIGIPIPIIILLALFMHH